ncbi:MAG: zinc-binding dehydrogenase [Pseudonocardia sp.]
MTHTCLAAVTRQPDRTPTVEMIELREPRTGEVLVRTRSAGICGTDLHFAAGTFPYPMPTVLGHEASGVVEAIGDGVNWVKPGDRVIVCDQTFCGRCADCVSGRMVYCTDTQAKQRQRDRLLIDGGPRRQYLGVSAFAELMLVDENSLIAVPHGLSDDAAALLACCITTGAATIFNVARPRPGAAVAVFGCGGVGLGAIQAAKAAGASTIVAIDAEQHRLAVAKELGATHVVDAGIDDPVEVVRTSTGIGMDIAIEAVGLAITAAQAFSVLAPGGQAVVLGMLPPEAEIVLPGRAIRQGRSIGGSVMGNVRTREDIPRFINLVQTGSLSADRLATAHYPLAAIGQALADARSRRGVRTMIRF